MFPATVLDWLVHNLVWNKTNLIKIPVSSTVAGLQHRLITLITRLLTSVILFLTTETEKLLP